MIKSTLLQLGLGLGYGEVVPLALIGREHRQQHDGEHGKDDAEQGGAGLRERFVRGRGSGQTDDLGVNRVITQQGRCGHGAETGDEGHDRQREHRGDQGGEDHLPEHLEGLGSHVAGGFHGVVVDAADGVSQEEHVVRGTGEGHREEDRVKTGEPCGIDTREGVFQRGGDDAVAGIEKHIAGDAQDLGALDVKVHGQQYDGNADDVDREHQEHGELQGVPDVLSHAAREEEADDRKGIPLSGGVFGVEDTGQRVETGEQHEAEEQIGKECDPDDPQDRLRVKLSIQCPVHDAASASPSGGYAITSRGSMITLTCCPTS